MSSPSLDPGPWPSERALRRKALYQLVYIALWCAILATQLLINDDRDGLWVATLVCWTVLIAASTVQFVADVKAVRGWRRLPVEGDERMVWGTSAQLILPTGSGGYGGVFGLSSTRLRYVPRWFARVRGLREQEWPVAALGAVSVQPYDGRRRLGGGRWVVLDVAGEASVVILNPEQHLVAADLHSALSGVREDDPALPLVDPA